MTMNLPALPLRMFRAVGWTLFPIRGAMADNLELNVEFPGKTLSKQASGFRQLANESLDEGFRSRLLDLALDYEHQADKLRQHPSCGSATATRPPRSRA